MADDRQSLIRTAWRESGKVYGYRKLHNIRTPEGFSYLAVAHSDQGSQFTSMEWASFLKHHDLQPLMSRPCNCNDNAVAESFFKLLKRERIRRKLHRTRTRRAGTCSITSRCSPPPGTERGAVTHRVRTAA
ncbi:MAG: hypothetical protein BGP06_14645 [Rhizobiales bacterium 65-9]|nr:MAG: hypothetical protein BGP06_14645 [Rhizobiales bacterium 65-9]